jgi:hypothetical protein
MLGADSCLVSRLDLSGINLMNPLSRDAQISVNKDVNFSAIGRSPGLSSPRAKGQRYTKRTRRHR